MKHAATCWLLIGVTGPDISASGEALIGSVSDDPYDIRTFLRQITPAGFHAHLGTELISTSEHTLTERGYFAHLGETTRGLNERGLAFISAMIFETALGIETPIRTKTCLGGL